MLDKREKIERIKATIQTFPNFPKKGILFYDILPILTKPTVLQDTIDVFSQTISALPRVDCILALESRGFLFGPIIALHLNIPFIPIRKAGKLPGPTKKISYTLEYGKDTLEIQDGPISPGSKCVIVDDLLATGGTLGAATKLVKSCEAEVVLSIVMIELKELKGREKVESPLSAMIQY